MEHNTKNTTRIHHVYTTHIEHKIHTTQKIQHKLGVLDAGLEELRCFPR